MGLLNDLYKEMIRFNNGDPSRIQHLTKVHSYCKLIGECEEVDCNTQFILEAAALTHDIGIKPAEEQYGACHGKLQEEIGPAYAKDMLQNLGFEEEVIERVCYLIGHHHTYTDVGGIDYRILLEADFLVNLYEDHSSIDAVNSALKTIFRTNTGTDLCKTMFL